MTANINGKPSFVPVFKPSYKNTEAKKIADEKAQLLKQQETEEKNRLKAQQQARQTELDMLKQQLESSEKQADATEDSFNTFSKCLVIAQRISRGDKVPTQDMKYLMKHEPDLYKQSILLRQPNSKPKEHDTVLDEEDLEENTEQSLETGLSVNSTSEPPKTEIITE